MRAIAGMAKPVKNAPYLLLTPQKKVKTAAHYANFTELPYTAYQGQSVKECNIMETGFTLSINSNEGFNLETISLPSGWATQYPAVASLLYFHRFHPEISVVELIVSAHLDENHIWEPLLNNSRTLSIYDFPPEILTPFGHTLEIQAALILIHICTLKKLELQIHLNTEGVETKSRILTILENAHSMQPESAEKIPSKLLSLLALKVTPCHTLPATSFQTDDELFLLNKANRCLLAFWLSDETFFSRCDQKHDSEQCYVLQVLWLYAKNQTRSIPAEITSPLARHYIYAATSASDEVVIDKLFLRTYLNTTDAHYAEAIDLYAHIKCGLAADVQRLDRMIDHCRASNLNYWLGYFLSYGQVIRSYNENYDRNEDMVRLSEAYRVYKKMNDWACVTRALHSKSTLLSKKMRFRGSKRYLKICLAIRLFLQDTLGISRVLNGISYIESQLEAFEDAIEYSRQSVQYLERSKDYEELAFTFCQISWYYFLTDQFNESVRYGLKTIATMQHNGIQTLPYRTKPDIYAQLGLTFFYNQQLTEALEYSDYCESHKVESTATGEIFRILLRAVINDERGESHLSDISFNYIPELLSENSEIDPHIELLFKRILLNRLITQGNGWQANNLKQEARKLCEDKNYPHSIEWFN